MRDGGARYGFSNWERWEADVVGLCLRSIACQQDWNRAGFPGCEVTEPPEG